MANKLAAELVLEIGKFKKGLRKAQDSVNRFGGKGGKAGTKLAGGIASGIAKSTAMMTAALAAVLTVAAGIAAFRAGQIIARAIATAAEHEKYQMRFEVLTGSRGAGNRVLQDLREDAMRTGVEVGAMADNVGKFIAFGFSPDRAVQLNKGILDVGRSVGLSTRDMKLLGVALSQVAAKGVANMEELRQQIAEKGIPIFKALEKQLGVTGAELSKMIQEGKVSADDVLNMFTAVPDGEGPFARFAGGAEKMANTFEGRVDRIKRMWEEFLRVMGGPIIDALAPLLAKAVSMMDNMRKHAEKIGTFIADMVTGAIAFARVFMSLDWDGMKDIMVTAFTLGIMKIGNFMWKVFSGVLSGYIRFFVEGIKNVLTLFGILAKPTFWSGMLKVLGGIAVKFGQVLLTILGQAISDVKEAGGTLAQAIIGDTDKAFFDKADSLGETGNGMLSEGADNLGPHIEEMMQRYQDQMGAAAKAFVEGFNEAGDAFDTSKQEDKLSGFLAMVQAMYDKMRLEREKLTRDRNRLDGNGADFSDANRKAGKFDSGFALNSRLSQAMNVIHGRSAYEVIARTAEKQHQEQKKTNDTLKKIESNTKPKRPNAGGLTVIGSGQDFSNFA